MFVCDPGTWPRYVTHISYFNYREGTLLNNTLFCNVWGFMWYVFAKISILLVAMLSLTRTISLLLPFKRINKKVIITVIVFYFGYLAIPASSPYWYHDQYTFSSYDMACGFYASGSFLLSLILGNLQYLLPIFPILIACVISTYKLLRPLIITVNTNSRSNVKVSSTVTILCFTMVYVVFNIPVCVIWILITIDYFNGFKYNFLAFDLDGYYFYNFISVHSVALNSTINPIIYISRIKCFRERTKSTVRYIRSTMHLATRSKISELMPRYHDGIIISNIVREIQVNDADMDTCL